MTVARSNLGAIILRGEIQRDRLHQKVRNARAVGALTVPVPVEDLVQIANRLDDLTTILRGHHSHSGSEQPDGASPSPTENPAA